MAIPPSRAAVGLRARSREGRPLLRLGAGQLLVQAGYYGFVASLPLVLSRAGIPDATIGLVVGLAALVQIPAALAAGALVDRFGSRPIIALGTGAYVIAMAILLLVDAGDRANLVALCLARVAQGIGFALVGPAWLSLVPSIVSLRRRGAALGFAGSVQTLALIAMPPLSLFVLGQDNTLDRVVLVMLASVLLGAILMAFRIDPPSTVETESHHGQSSRRFGLAFRREWAPPLLITFLYLVHWGVVTAYLPQRAELFGATVAWFFIADSVVFLSLRIPSGWLVDRIEAKWMIASGLITTAIAMILLLAPPTDLSVALAGMLTGLGSGLIVTPLHISLARISSVTERGSAFALLSAALATSWVVGSIGFAPLIATIGFEAAAIAAVISLILALLPTARIGRWTQSAAGEG